MYEMTWALLSVTRGNKVGWVGGTRAQKVENLEIVLGTWEFIFSLCFMYV